MFVSLKYYGERMWIPYPDRLSPEQLKGVQRLTDRERLAWPEDYERRMEETVWFLRLISGLLGAISVLIWFVITGNPWILLALIGVAMLIVAIRVGIVTIPVRIATTRNKAAVGMMNTCSFGYRYGKYGAPSLLDRFLTANGKDIEWLRGCDPQQYSYLLEFLEDPAVNEAFTVLRDNSKAVEDSKLTTDTRLKLDDAISSKAKAAFAQMEAPRVATCNMEQAVLEDRARRALDYFSPDTQ